jgi:hypothetical protein
MSFLQRAANAVFLLTLMVGMLCAAAIGVAMTYNLVFAR